MGTENRPYRRPAFRFMGSLRPNSGAYWDLEPRAWSADLQVGAFGARHPAPSWSSALRRLVFVRAFITAGFGLRPRAQTAYFRQISVSACSRASKIGRA